MRPNVLVITKDMPREEWLAIRRGSIGASEAAAVAGLSPWANPLTVWMDKVGAAPEQDQTDAMEMGTLLEPVVAEVFTRRTGFPTKRRNAILQHPQYPWMTANLDRLTKDTSGRWVPCELKTASAWKSDDWDAAVPEHYQLQVQHQLAVADADHGWICVLIGGQTPRWARIDRNPTVIAHLITIEQAFWTQHVLTRTPPMVDGSDATTDLLKALYPVAEDGSTVQWEDEALDLIKRYWTAHKAAETHLKEKEEVANTLRLRLGEAEAAYIPSLAKPVVTWKNGSRKGFEEARFRTAHPDLYAQFVRATPTRTLRPMKFKEESE